MASSWIRWLAASMVVANATAWVMWSRWERPGSGVELRARVKTPPLLGRGSDLLQIVPFVFPVVVAIAPGWAYEGPLNWSSGIDGALQAGGIALWALGLALGIWAAPAIGGYGAVSGVTADHKLVSEGPYRHIRHPIYTALIAIAAGTTLAFRSYLMLGVAAPYTVAHLWWAAAEEKLLGSPEGLGDEYRAYAARTGRFLPRLRQARRPNEPL